MANDLFEGIEISEELLASIAGGVLTDEARALLDQSLPLLKRRGATKARAIEIFSLTDDPQLREDTLAYIDEVWDTL